MAVAANPELDPGAELEDLARRAGELLRRYDDVVGVCLLGSVARGDATAESDVDLLVLTDPPVRRSRLIRRLPPSLRDDRLSILSVERIRWIDEAKTGSLFAHHVSREGVILADAQGVLNASFRVLGTAPWDVTGEIERQLQRLRLYKDLQRLNGQYLFALSHLYAIGKAIAIARCAELGQPTFIKEAALERLAGLRPELAEDSRRIRRLRPFYDRTHGRAVQVLPFPAEGTEDEVRAVVAAIERLARG